MEHKIKVIITFRNVGDYIIDAVNSVFNQQYKNYEVHLFDDFSDDNTLGLLDDEFENLYKYRNEKRKGPLGNLYLGLKTINADPDDIIVLLDGDDFIFGEYAFQILNHVYTSNVLLTYGQYITNTGIIGHCSPYTEREFDDIRKAPWKASHLKTFKYKLFNELLRQDPDVSSFKDKTNGFFMATSDMAIMIPLLQIAGVANTRFIENVLYCYRLSPKNDHATGIGRQRQIEAELEIRNKPRLKQLF